ncbi:DUF3109 family protein [Prevotella sp. OH937_COT-195]|uniref:DUF3109 family protein n=1 Tax=Prevotella sp. OH937_COT-195 TaxID=2491051 RepID=UPI000F655454|nr:DUF3109 family protein [Prevotella sp. OH937_COT-195]RRD00781.1 DUF3109 family protein [Prevotella sp. OH937_COT-195]
MNGKKGIGIIDISGVLISSDIIYERFCCDLEKCKGQCCVEGDAGAPVTPDEIMEIENVLDVVFNDLSEQAQEVIVSQGVAYTDKDGELVTSIVGGRDCVFTCYDDIEMNGVKVKGCCLCRLEKAYRDGLSSFCKPASCALYPIRVKTFNGGLVGLNYNRWNICDCAREKGRQLNIPVYRFLREPLIKRFGEEWYRELENVAAQLLSEK